MERAPDFRRIALNCSRQWGKSTVAAVLAVFRLITQPGAMVLVVGPSQRQSGETVQKVRKFLAVLGLKKLRGDGTLPNGSRIVALPAMEATIRCFSAVSMLIIDEASRVPDEVWQALLPSLAVSNGDLVVLSTPKGRRGRFYREMTAPENEGVWLRHTGPVTECGRVPEEFLAEERRQGGVYFEEEYLCQFVETGKHLFDEALVDKMVNRKEQPWRVI